MTGNCNSNGGALSRFFRIGFSEIVDLILIFRLYFQPVGQVRFYIKRILGIRVCGVFIHGVAGQIIFTGIERPDPLNL